MFFFFVPLFLFFYVLCFLLQPSFYPWSSTTFLDFTTFIYTHIFSFIYLSIYFIFLVTLIKAWTPFPFLPFSLHAAFTPFPILKAASPCLIYLTTNGTIFSSVLNAPAASRSLLPINPKNVQSISRSPFYTIFRACFTIRPQKKK